MKRITIIGMGLGIDSITAEAWKAVEQADVLLGAPRLLELCEDLAKPSYPYYLPGDVKSLIAQHDAQEFAVLVSGDVGFYSAAAGLIDTLTEYDLCSIPGISTVNAFFAKLKLPWQDAEFVSLHGRNMNIVDTVRRSRLTFCLTGNNAREIGSALCQAGLGHIKTHVGENLGTMNERVYEMIASDLIQGNFRALTVLLFINDEYDDSVPAGLPDSSFIRLTGIPMTKSEMRALVLSKLNVHPGDICWDIGAGTGSVTVELALCAYRGSVYAVERREDAVSLIGQNCQTFHIGNVTTVCGQAPAVLDALPAPDAVFIGGSGGELPEIIAAVLRKNLNARMVVTAVTIETVTSALSAFAKVGLEPEIVQINIARAKKAGSLHMMEAQNPITVFSAGGRSSPGDRL